MKKSLLLIMFVAIPVAVSAADRDSVLLKFDYNDVAIGVRFDNREYGDDNLEESRTLFGIRADAALGLRIEAGNTRHRIIGGVSPLYEFGGPWKWQPILYYELSTPLAASRFGIVAGAFQRNKSEAYYSPAFYSDYTKFYDNTFEGIQFNWKGRNFYYELGCDWMGMYSQKVREEFSIYSGGYHRFVNVLRLGYSARFHHYACSGQADNVVGDILLNPWIEADFGYFAGIQSITCHLAYLQAFQRDRGTEDALKAPAKGRFFFDIRNWNVGISNDLYFGGDLMPYFDSVGPDGLYYGRNLYMGDPLMRNRNGADFGVFDRISLYWQPRIAKVLDLRLQVDVDFNGGYAGSRQSITLIYRLKDSIRK